MRVQKCKKCENALSQFFTTNCVTMWFMWKKWKMRKVRNARNVCDFSHKKVINHKNFSLFLQFFTILHKFLCFSHLSFYTWSFLAMQKSKKCDMREMINEKNSRNNAIREILFLAIKSMHEIFAKCVKIKKFKKCDNYCTCLKTKAAIRIEYWISFLIRLILS